MNTDDMIKLQGGAQRTERDRVRDAFAMAALTGALTNPNMLSSITLMGDKAVAFDRNLAVACYALAEAMLTERDKEKS